jgi:hypothetical protein
MRRAATLVVLAILAGCGDDKQPARPVPAAPAPARHRPTDAQVRDALRLPARVPLRPSGPARGEDVAVVRSWLVELSRGQVKRAAQRFALPARFQNFGAVAVIRTPLQALAITASLPCGARMTAAGGANGFVVYEARLIERPGGDCGAGVGGIVRGAVRVRDGRMTEWYRLPDRSRPRAGQRVTPDGPIV